MKYSLWAKEKLPLTRRSASEVFVTFRRDLESYLPGDRPRTPGSLPAQSPVGHFRYGQCKTAILHFAFSLESQSRAACLMVQLTNNSGFAKCHAKCHAQLVLLKEFCNKTIVWSQESFAHHVYTVRFCEVYVFSYWKFSPLFAVSLVSPSFCQTFFPHIKKSKNS